MKLALVLGERGRGLDVDVVGLNEASTTMVERYGTHHREGAEALQVVH